MKLKVLQFSIVACLMEGIVCKTTYFTPVTYPSRDFCENDFTECDLEEKGLQQAWTSAFNNGDSNRDRSKRSFTPYKIGTEVATKVSKALDQLLFESGYDKRIRPQVGGPPLPITVNFEIRSMGPVDENSNSYSLDCYFRQYWVDERLQYNMSETDNTLLVLNWAFLTKIWVPDTFFINGKNSYLHKITVPNRFIRIMPDGLVVYSQRLTIWADCKMDLTKYPLDTQMCPLYIGSFGYDTNDVVYELKKPTAIDFNPVELAQFLLTGYQNLTVTTIQAKRRTRVRTGLTGSGFRNDSIVIVRFYFERQTGFFMLQIYTPLMLIVVCSWVTFWLVKTDKGGEVPARTSLGANAVLSVVSIGFGGESRPQIGYMTAMDLFIIICFVAVFAALLEFALVVFLDVIVKRRKAAETEKEEKMKKILENENSVVKSLVMGAVPILDATATVNPPAEEQKTEPDVETKDTVQDGDKEDKTWVVFVKIAQFTNYLTQKAEEAFERRYGPFTETYLYNNPDLVIYKIDRVSRIGFPIVFTLLMIGYWTIYLYLI